MFSFLSDLFVGLRTPLPRLLSCVKKVGKDHKEPSGSLTSGRERALPPLDFPSGESSLSRFSGAMTQNFEVECKIFRLLPLTRVSSIFSFRGLVPPTLALTFLLREKSAKAYPRGGVLLDISSFFHENSVDKKGGRVTALREGMVLVRKVNWFCFPSPENRILFDFHGDGASF